MSLPYDPKRPELQSAHAGTVGRDPSYPDRARIDSDVRAFLRPVSTPWIVFDRDSRADGGIEGVARSALRVGAVFASSPSFRPEVVLAAQESGTSPAEIAALPLAVTVADPFRPGGTLAARSSVLSNEGVFPPGSSARDNPHVEPSSLTVASDVVSESAPPPSSPARSSGLRRLAIIAGACGGLAVAAAAVGTFLTHAPPPVAAETVQAPPAAANIPAPEARSTKEPVPFAPPAAVETPATSSEPAAAKTPADPKKRFGKLTLKGEATRKVVWFDGKRMLGNGPRSFVVFCGMHTVAVNDKADSKDIDIPCNGEYVVSK